MSNVCLSRGNIILAYHGLSFVLSSPFYPMFDGYNDEQVKRLFLDKLNEVKEILENDLKPKNNNDLCCKSKFTCISDGETYEVPDSA